MGGKQKTIELTPETPVVRQHLQAAAAKTQAEAAASRTPPEFQRGKDLVIVLQWCEADLAATLRLADWIAALGTDNLPEIYSYCPKDTPESIVDLVTSKFDEHGLGASLIQPPFDLPDERYPRGSTWGFINIAEQMHRLGNDFLLMEPDMIPLRSAWWDRLHGEVNDSPWPYVGHIEPAHPSGGYPTHMAGCGVYHHDVFRYFPFNRLDLAWDVALGEHVVPLAQQSQCIQQVFGATEPPRFRGQADIDRIIRPDAVLFHRNKDGSLIRLLRERYAL